ncbi:MAG: hypothetical protein M3167_00790 [Acidobacteriota bacterium]|nr:hypothetical protein [Acidobacteriota bacterium]
MAYANALDSAALAVPGSVYTVEGDDLQVFVYPTETAAAADASRIAPSGGAIGTTALRWIAPPHFFRRGAMIAIYLGSDRRIREALSAELGGQIAGAD